MITNNRGGVALRLIKRLFALGLAILQGYLSVRSFLYWLNPLTEGLGVLAFASFLIFGVVCLIFLALALGKHGTR